MNEKLIFDIGFHKGEDTKYYLSQGYKVVAVEANPILVEEGVMRFKSSVDSGDLILLNVGIAEKSGALDFWINEVRSEWSSFDQAIGCRSGTSCRSIQVPCVSTSELIHRYGIPWYMKIDIEGYDLFAINSISPEMRPKYLSCEVSDLNLVYKMIEIGYTKFKMINQATRFTAIDLAKEQSRTEAMKRRVIRSFMRRTASIVDWSFPFDSSGPFGEDTDGAWRSASEIEELFRVFMQYDLNKPLNSISWFDFHATY